MKKNSEIIKTQKSLRKKSILKMIFFFFSFVFLFLFYKNYHKIPGAMDFIFQKEISVQKYKTESLLEKAALKQFGVVTKYDFSQGYYVGGRPADKDTGVCSDVVVDAFLALGVDLKKEIFKDISKNPKDYSDKPDININHRRAKNIAVYMAKYHKTLPLDFKKKENLKTWKGGDIVVWKNHIAIVSSKKRKDGLPYVISNHGSGTILADILDSWSSPLVGHYRVEFSK